jgi:NADH:ubiquinone oxidoreductase subunit H
MIYISLVSMLMCAVIAVACVIAERKSRKWYQDRLMLQLSGFFGALALVAFCVMVFSL